MLTPQSGRKNGKRTHSILCIDVRRGDFPPLLTSFFDLCHIPNAQCRPSQLCPHVYPSLVFRWTPPVLAPFTFGAPASRTELSLWQVTCRLTTCHVHGIGILRLRVERKYLSRTFCLSKCFLAHGPNMIITRTFSLTNFVIATSALGFQVFVLYPWHERLDEDFRQLKIEHLKALREGEEKRIQELRSIRLAIEKMEADKKTGWSWR